MIGKWRLVGARFPMPDGRWIERGDVFEAHHNSRVVTMRRHKLEPVAPAEPTTVDEPPNDPETLFPGVDFGSDKAYELARDKGLSANDFDGFEGSGVKGAILKGDVKDILDG